MLSAERIRQIQLAAALAAVLGVATHFGVYWTELRHLMSRFDDNATRILSLEMQMIEQRLYIEQMREVQAKQNEAVMKKLNALENCD